MKQLGAFLSLEKNGRVGRFYGKVLGFMVKNPNQNKFYAIHVTYQETEPIWQPVKTLRKTNRAAKVICVEKFVLTLMLITKNSAHTSFI